ncbi:MAG: glycosyltransferase [Bacteroidia bacterium]|nr:glycosyltransferase [Bacteroidia bacterium]
MDKLKIGLVFIGGFPEGEVHNSRIRNIGLGFIHKQWECDFISLYPTSFSKKRNNSKQKIWNNQKVVHIGGWNRYPKFYIIRFIQLIYCHLAFILFVFKNTRNYNVLYFYTPQLISSLPGMLLSKLLGVKIIIDYTDLHSANSNKLLHKIEENLMVKYSDCMFVISSFLYNHFQSRHNNIHHIPMMINFSDFRQTTESIPFNIGYIGSFGEKDGIVNILDAFAIALKNEPRLTLTLIGRDPQYMKTKELINLRGLNDYVCLKGGISHARISKELKVCDTFIMNRKKSIYSDSGYPAKLGDYLACNRPILMSDEVFFSSDFEHKREVFKYKNDDPSDLAKAILYRYDNLDEMTEISVRGHKYAKIHFNSEKISSRLVEVANQLVNNK